MARNTSLLHLPETEENQLQDFLKTKLNATAAACVFLH